MFRTTSTKMLICDMAGTTIQEKGIVYNSLYRTIRLIHPNLQKNDIKPFGGAKKREVIKYFVNKKKMDSPEVVINNLDSEFNYFLKKEYQENPSVQLIHPNLPSFFNSLRDQDIKICLNTGYNKEIQQLLIDKFNMTDFIDDYISSEEVDFGRPYPYMIHALMKRNNIFTINHVVKIGDTEMDIKEGKNASCRTVGVLSGAHTKEQLEQQRPNFIVDNIMDIKFY